MSIRGPILVVVLSCLSAVASHSACSLIIDDFSSGAISINQPAGQLAHSVVQTELDSESVAAGARTIVFRAHGATHANLEIDTTDPGALRITSDRPNTSGIFSLIYGNGLNSSTNFGQPEMKLDLTAGGADGLAFDFTTIVTPEDPDNFTSLFFEVTLKATNFSRVTQRQSINAVNGQQSVLFSFDEYSGYDFSDVTYIEFTTNTILIPFELTSIHTVPEPSSATLVVSGILLIGLRWRQSR